MAATPVFKLFAAVAAWAVLILALARAQMRVPELDTVCSFKNRDFLTVPWNCSQFIRCTPSGEASVFSCPSGSIYRRNISNCEWPSTRDPAPCAKDPSDLLPVFCNHFPTGKRPHPHNCAQFFDCQHRDVGYLMECPYSQLFDPVTSQCKNFQLISCGTKYTPKAPCDYETMCSSPDCSKCKQDNPSCIGMPDGLNSYPGFRNSPLYVECFHERTMKMDSCPKGNFDPFFRECRQSQQQSLG